ncbi:MAG: hypothetical protein Q7T11_04465 [Deltaproteobacteria bacterium]|nr:hypothetical protein [Deltaproteobacteria bacterium]
MMILLKAPSGRRLFFFFSSSKIICVKVTAVRSSPVLLSITCTSSPALINRAMSSSVT